ncbi:dynamin family protein [Metabacillus litoralis]|uniref:dynamin family protein n=1 Tax=Metabacillus litoralis TaxID=152268 RepID=UPI00203C3DFC|nr:dynamin family protein [Metabacillus litoralis]MCM3163028.1 dynamin family protein [Metabacillus litoralis]
MTTAVKSKDLMQIVINLHDEIKKHDTENAHKLVELANKLYHQKLYVAFAGHFSAGKSSMINKLLDEQILPTSPIPTSANLVLLERGQEQVTLYSSAKESIELAGDYSIEQVKEYCKQGDEIERISIKKPYQNLEEDIVIMDSPGIDSTDAAHKLSTESMLHIADTIFYVTDYNHVQSEENLSFIKEMKDRNKVIFLIVNQIDKHVEKEIEFNHFKKHIEDSFAEVGLHPQDVFFTTLKDDQHPANQLEQVKDLIKVIVEDKKRYIDQNVHDSVTQVVKEHLEKYEDQLNLTDVDEKEVRDRLTTLLEQKQTIEKKIKKEEKIIENLTAETNDKVSAILKSANLIPYETREKAAAYIEAVDPSFKIGFLFTKSKTDQERDRRKNELYESLKQNIETQISWHFQSLLKEYLKTYEIHDPEVIQQVQSFSVKVTEQIITDAMKAGASYNNQYVLTYSSDVSELIKKHSKQQVMSVFQKIIDYVRESRQNELETIYKDLTNCKVEMAKSEELVSKFENLSNYEENILNVKHGKLVESLDDQKWLEENQFYKKSVRTLELDEALEGIVQPSKSDLDDPKTEQPLGNRDEFIQQAENMLKALENIRGFKQFTDSLEGKIKSYKNRSFTVALFGAFSAGKSSFANALIGEGLLPSSPNPTTATINKIAPVTNEKHHGLVEVKLKSKEALQKEVIESIPTLSDKDTSTFEVFVKSVLNHQGKDQNEIDQLTKYKTALPDYQSLTTSGLLLTSSKETFKDFVANENKACLVEEVIVYFDCPITRAGITLVDTPGADSLHKRHTDVAFQYIKKADAILYVTYYNHPFSKGDREFLRQLGRVKDSFTLDKMFFIINAVDLAKDEEEVELVKAYIRDQFLKHEIRNVRLYGVSSLNILSENLTNEKDYATFKQQFDTFIKKELTNTTIISIREDLRRSKERIEALIDAAEKSGIEKEQIRKNLLNEKQKVKEELTQVTNQHLMKTVTQEIEELVFYLKQRLFFRFNEFFKESFHPSVFHQTSDTQQALQTCLNDLVRTVEFELVQELQATSLRIENVIKKTFDDEYIRISQLIKKQSQSITLSSVEIEEILTPDISVEFSRDMIEKLKPSLKLFKNTKSFFEKNEKKLMGEDLTERFNEPVSMVLDNYNQKFADYYQHTVMQMHSSLIQQITVQTEESFGALLDIQFEDTGHLKQEQSNLSQVIGLLA